MKGNAKNIRHAHFLAQSSERPARPPPVVVPIKIGRNEPCPCGSGKKYKQCCLLTNKIDNKRGLASPLLH
ncbi:SEC-C metal-binding domain-containing protein [Aeromonas hydrophila]|uniref:SEC-C metal-binding domain-containing protein n=1 Tax=Aeromonas hydrophila TaxID=644 RepID=UPI003670AD46